MAKAIRGPMEERRVSHHVALERFHERDARILTATAAIWQRS
jgi:hypothetical protein